MYLATATHCSVESPGQYTKHSEQHKVWNGIPVVYVVAKHRDEVILAVEDAVVNLDHEIVTIVIETAAASYRCGDFVQATDKIVITASAQAINAMAEVIGHAASRVTSRLIDMVKK